MKRIKFTCFYMNVKKKNITIHIDPALSQSPEAAIQETLQIAKQLELYFRKLEVNLSTNPTTALYLVECFKRKDKKNI